MGGLGKGGAHVSSRVVVDTQFTKVYVNPRTATGAIGPGAEVARATKLLITSTTGGLRERLKKLVMQFTSGTDLGTQDLVYTS